MKSPFIIPGELRKHVTQSLDKAGAAWLGELPEIVSSAARKWDLTVGEAFPSGEFNFVAPATSADGGDAILKIAPPWPDGECFSEAAFLRHKSGNGCDRLLEQDVEARAMLLERAVPGRNLVEEFADCGERMIGPAVDVLKRLKEPPPKDAGFVIYLDDWFSNLERSKGTTFSASYAENALGFYDELTKRASRLYLHGDFHPGNIVTATREPHLVIDPKGIIGPMGYDIGVFLNNMHWWSEEHCSDTNALLNTAIAEFSAAMEIPESDLRKWAYAVQVLGSWWTFDEMPALYTGGVVKADIWDV